MIPRTDFPQHSTESSLKMSANLPQAKATANIKKNRLHVSINGNIDSNSLERLYTEIRFCVADLKEGFDVIKDISQCNLIYISGLPTYKKIMDFLVANKVGEIVRVIKNNNLSFKQIINFSEKIHSYKTIYAEDQEDAEIKLEQLIRREGIRFKLDNLTCTYRDGIESGKGKIIDISVSGCAFQADSRLEINKELQLIIQFAEYADLQSNFSLKAKIVRANGEHFAAHFLNLDSEQKELLYQRLATEVSRIPFVY